MNKLDIGLSEKEAKRVMAEADFNNDGEIEYAEFIPLAVELVQAMYAKMEAEDAARKHVSQLDASVAQLQTRAGALKHEIDWRRARLEERQRARTEAGRRSRSAHGRCAACLFFLPRQIFWVVARFFRRGYFREL